MTDGEKLFLLHGNKNMTYKFCFLAFLALTEATSQSKRPNIIFILSDDLGYDDLGYSYSQQTHTPTLDKFQSESRVLEWYYGQTNCSPTRSSIQTGRLPSHIGINSVIMQYDSFGVGLENMFISDALKQYKTIFYFKSTF